ncbi:GNAT family N-acetyltransferase [Microbacterium telephonicum]|uniref:Ribosomal protein S18 acetylase RimI-like enzyme n=1 Tax=Microbacterium telephonicum TaxID=1714841 RepID=A0A498CIU2_9MICO|nr:GNAT family N-acetyltransferase [Microbacterium telephonicum]RLK52148.1 ribosomal protein S18 acetylase RimI-like enzyme [Microbacterium telephonicum]
MPENSLLSVAPSPARSVEIVAVPHDDPRAAGLREVLDLDLDARYRGAEPEPPAVSAARADALRVHPDQLVATLLAVTADGEALGHVMLRRLGDEWELKRLVVAPEARGAGVGRRLVQATIDLARTGGAARVILQTGAAQPESLALYRSFGFTPIPVYEPYVATMPTSLCFTLPL